MNSGPKCRECGTVISAGSPAGLCGKCLLSLGLDGAHAVPNLDVPSPVWESLAEAEACAQGLGPPPRAPGSEGTVLVERPPTEKSGDRIGRYKLLEKIGEGGCGVVYVAEQIEPVRRRIALKVIKAGMDTKAVVARFEAERQALALMDHPNISKVLDAGTTDTGRPYFVMELVRGIKITDFCDQASLSTKVRIDLFIKVCQAIQHAHQKGIIHRDLKPSNILVTLHDGVPVPKVIDFGIAKAIESHLTDATVYTQLHQFIGTPAYMSPEQAEMSGLDIDTRSDIYSLGVLLYELLAGSTPFDPEELMAAGIDAMRKTIREREPLRPSTRFATLKGAQLTSVAQCRSEDAPKLIHLLKGDLDWIVMKCLEKDRARRYDTANGLAMDLKRHLNDEPVVARPPSTAYRFQKAFRRNKLAFSAATAVAAALVAGIGLSAWQTLAARKAQRGEEIQRRQAQRKQAEAEAERQRAWTEQQRADAQARQASESQQQSRRLLYASDMNLAQQALQLNNLGKARRLLDRHRPQPGEEDLRGWEWRYLWQLTRSSALLTLTNRPARGFSLSFSPDGTRLAVGWFDGRVDLWDVPDHRLLRALTDREYSHAGRVAFSPVSNKLAATSDPKTLTLYDLDSGRESILWRMPDPEDFEVRDVAFSQDGSEVVIYAGITSGRVRGDSQSLLPDQVWVVKVASANVESHHTALFSGTFHHGAARLSPDNLRLYLARSDAVSYRYSIQCIDLATGQELWQTEPQRDYGLSALDISPDGRVLASGSGFEDPTIRIWDAATGRPLVRLDGHTAWVCKLAFSKDGRRLVSAASDQCIRIWDTSTWTEISVLRGHADEVCAVAVSEPAQLIASASKDGDLVLWKENGASTAVGYRRLPEDLGIDQVLALDHSRLLSLSPNKPPELLDLKRDSTASLTELGSSTNVLGWFGTNLLCLWSGTNQILVRESRGADFVHCATIALKSTARPAGLAYNLARQLLAWSELASPTSVYVASLATPDRTIELHSDLPGLVPVRFSEDGNYLVAVTRRQDALRVWNVETGQILASAGGFIRDTIFADSGSVLIVVAEEAVQTHPEIQFYDLVHYQRAPRRVARRYISRSLAVSPDGRLVVSSSDDGQVLFLDAGKGELTQTIHAHLNAAFGVAFSPDGRRLISTGTGREAIKLWDVGTLQELLTLHGTGSVLLAARWSADGDVILAGPPWQSWRAPSWDEIDAAEKMAERKTQ